MIADRVVSGVADYLSSSGASALSGVNVYERDAGTDKAYPCIVVEEEGVPEEHEVIKGQWTVGINVIVQTRPEGDEAASTHRDITEAVWNLMGNSPALVAHLSSSLECHDSWGGQGATEPADGYRQTTFFTEIRAAEV